MRTAPQRRSAVAHGRTRVTRRAPLVDGHGPYGPSRRASRGWSRVGARRPCAESGRGELVRLLAVVRAFFVRRLFGRRKTHDWVAESHLAVDSGDSAVGQTRVRRRAAYQAMPATAAPTPTAVPAIIGLGGVRSPERRLRSETGRVKSSTGQPRSRAILRSARSGFTAAG